MIQTGFGLAGLNAVVAGADGDIGRAVAVALGEQGCNVALLGRPEYDTEVAALSNEISANHSVRSFAVTVDFESIDSLNEAAAGVVSGFGGAVDCLVNNVVVEDKIDFLETSVESWDRQFRAIARAPFFLSQVFARVMVEEKRGGSIVNVGSVAGKVFWPRTAAYNAARGALIATTGTIALDLAPLNIRVNGVGAGHVETEMETQRLSRPGVRDQTIQELPIGRLGEPIDVANVVLFLLSESSAYVVGQTIVVDGGYTLQ